MTPRIISICGNIGCGKTTLLNYLSKKYNMKCLLEGIKDWGEILELSYSEPEKYSMSFQLRIISEQTLQKEEIDKMNENFVFIERSSDDGRHVFINVKKNDGYLDNIMINEIDRWCNIHKMGILPDLIVYLRTEPKMALTRIQQRQQSGDSFISLDFLEKLHFLYEQRYTKNIKNDYPKFSPLENVLVIENCTVEETAEKIFEWLKQ